MLRYVRHRIIIKLLNCCCFWIFLPYFLFLNKKRGGNFWDIFLSWDSLRVQYKVNSEKGFREHLLEVFRIQNLMSLFWTRNSVLTRNFWNLGPSDFAQFSRIFWKLRRIDVEILTKRLNILQRTRKLKERSLFPVLRMPQVYIMKF